jgi:hypothetical protein
MVTQQDYQAAVATMQECFADASGRAGIKAELLTLSASLVSAGEQFGRIAALRSRSSRSGGV